MNREAAEEIRGNCGHDAGNCRTARRAGSM
jgi:hypothetical protein